MKTNEEVKKYYLENKPLLNVRASVLLFLIALTAQVITCIIHDHTYQFFLLVFPTVSAVSFVIVFIKHKKRKIPHENMMGFLACLEATVALCCVYLTSGFYLWFALLIVIIGAILAFAGVLYIESQIVKGTFKVADLGLTTAIFSIIFLPVILIYRNLTENAKLIFFTSLGMLLFSFISVLLLLFAVKQQKYLENEKT